jgi:hypothetical protein
MSRTLKVAVAASFLSLSATSLLAQGATGGAPGGSNKGDSNTGLSGTPDSKTDPNANKMSSGSRALTPGGGGVTTSPETATKPDGSPSLKKLDKQGRGGQQN